MIRPAALFGKLWCVWAFLAACLAAVAARANEPIDYRQHIKPILALRCFSCHGALKQENGLRLDASSLILKGSEDGPVIVPGDSAASRLVARISAADETRMPPEGEPLAAEEIERIRAWIDQGAAAPEEPIPPDPRKHWSFRPPVRPPLPAGFEGLHPVDAFLGEEYARLGIEPLGPAEKHVLLRRVYLDLIGLPPSRAELHAFLADTAPDAYERVVDRLLASERYGERWGRHWMDVWRYSDASGYGNEVRYSQRHIWRWRDWIVESLNADKPYDRMLQEMLAADELAPADPQALRATGYLARNWYRFNRNTWLDATLEHTFKAFLGITLNCARCHDHMYDPIVQEDYYRVRAFFEPHQVRTDRVPGQPDIEKDGLARVFDQDLAAPTYLYVRGNEKEPVTDRPLEPGLPAVLGGSVHIEPVALPPQAYYPGLAEFYQKETLEAARAAAQQAAAALDEARAKLAQAEAALAAAQSSEPAGEVAGAAVQTPSAPSLVDDFAEPRPDVWETGPGQWRYVEGRLRQEQTGNTFCWMRTQADHPRDFIAELRFTPLGGQMWHSVGIGFDMADESRFDAVYLSAYGGGSKLQVFHRRGAQDAYPAEGAVPYAAELGKEYLLRVAVRDRLVNVSVNGTLLLAYNLPEERAPARLAFWSFDCAAEFGGFRADALDPHIALAERLPAGEASQPADLKQAVSLAQDAVQLAEKTHTAAMALCASVVARIEADVARYREPPAPNAQDLALAAAAAHRRYLAAKAEEDLLRAEQQAKAAQAALKAEDEAAKKAAAEAEQKLSAAREALQAARAALEQPSADYPPLSELYPTASSGRRLALARWMTSKENPLAARVAVNHIWMRHFGAPLVPTVFEFGNHGKPPWQPELLDWLAVEFVEQGWSMKYLHRLLVTSAAYRRASGPVQAGFPALKIDPDNRYLWRANRRRAEAEVVRDSLLHVAGRLDFTMGGPEIDQHAGLTVLRRSIYFRHAYERKMLFLTLFDGPSENECYQRTTSVVPQQALALANSSLALEQARLLAAQLSAQTAGMPDAEFVVAAFEQVLCRRPTEAEAAECLAFLQRQAALLADPARLALTATGTAPNIKPSDQPAQRARENLVHVLLNHHDFVTIH